MVDKGNVYEAIANYHVATTVCPPKYKRELAIYYNNIGTLFVKMSLLNEAELSFNTSLKYNPHYVKAVINRMHIYRRTKRYDKAIIDS